MKIKIKNTIGLFSLLLLLLTACEKSFLDVIPDNVATIDNAFNMRNNAEKFLFTCYSYMPQHGNLGADQAILGGDEVWTYKLAAPEYNGASFNHQMFEIAKGFQNKINPIDNGYWDDLFQGIRDCNIFLENIDKVPNLEEFEKRTWIAEVKFLKAYYHFYLLKMYGPIPIIRISLPIDASIEEVRVSRDPVDDCFNYIVELLDEAKIDLPLTIINPTDELGRINKPIAMALKAKVLVFMASPLFNGNSDFAALTSSDGTSLFNQEFKTEKWDNAAVACKEAIDVCISAGTKLYTEQGFNAASLSDTMLTQLSIRNSICEKWNSETIWANANSYTWNIQSLSTARVDPSLGSNYVMRKELACPLKITDQYYSDNGVPISEDKTWDYNSRYQLKKAEESERLFVKQGYETAKYHFNREPRYYANIGFDGGIWYGAGKYTEDDLWHIGTKFKQLDNNLTGICIKKWVHFENVGTGSSSYSVTSYPWPVIRLAGLYLLYAEALNESQGPSAQAMEYVDKVRERAGLKPIEEAWTNYSVNPSKYTSKEGLREIIRQERLIELAFEGKRFWDIRRWKIAPQVMNNDVMGWSTDQKNAVAFTKPRVLFSQKFGLKDYFFPIKDYYIIQNRNLVQNLGW